MPQSGVTINPKDDLVLSYSSLNTLSSCPRKFELYKVHPIDTPRDTSPALSLGSAVGRGYAAYLETNDIEDDKVILETWLGYYPPLEDNVRTLSKAHVIVQALADTGWAKNGQDDPCDWELATFNGVKATELSFCIRLSPKMVYVGFLDAVMYSPSTGIYRPLELKTSSLSANLEVNFKNSAQGLAYALILDAICHKSSPQLTFDIHYRVAQLHRTKAEAYRPTIHDFFFKKNLMDRLEWLMSLKLEQERIESYLDNSLFPKNGGACLSWNRPCAYYNMCNLTNNPPLEAPTKDYQFYFELDDLINNALTLAKGV